MQQMQTDVLIIGAGAVGTGIARDLALRGVSSVVVERGDINSGASGGNHGLLHSGGRYVAGDVHSARECREENELLKRLAPQCIEECGGLYVAVAGDDEQYIADFPGWCEAAGIQTQSVAPADARVMEPALGENLIAAYTLPDASLDPFRLSLENLAHAKALAGSILLTRTAVDGFELDSGRIARVRLKDMARGETRTVEASQVINAAGAWAGRVAGLLNSRAGASIPLLCSQGTLLVTHDRLSERVIHRLRPPGDGDILVPGGTVSILGTTSVTIPDPDLARPSVREVDVNLTNGAEMAPILASTRYVRAYCGVRPLLADDGSSEAERDGRSASRGFLLFDHENVGLGNFCSVVGGKLTTYRLMAEKTVDLVCGRLGNNVTCRTRDEPLPVMDACSWTEPGRSAKVWVMGHASDDEILCECELVSASAVDGLLQDCRDIFPDPDLQLLGKRSRIGKGACQGAFCGLRVASHLYDTGALSSRRGLEAMRGFFQERFKGQRPILWGAQMVQSELAEALHCGLLGLEFPAPESPEVELSHE
jgi:glycerol-3-phosphate dehydrogenase